MFNYYLSELLYWIYVGKVASDLSLILFEIKDSVLGYLFKAKEERRNAAKKMLNDVTRFIFFQSLPL